MSQNQPRASAMTRRGHSLLTRAQNMAKAAALAATMAMLASPSTRTGIAPIQAVGSVQISMSPTLYPAFDPGISDYVVAYNPNAPVQVSVAAPRSMMVSVDGQPFRKLSFTTNVNVTPGQSFSFVVSSAWGSKTYYVRCLPSDFPSWTTERSGPPPAEYYVIAPNISLSKPRRNYVILSDSYGVPLWWYDRDGGPIDAKLLSNGNIAWTVPPVAEEHQLDGTLVRTITSPSSIGGEVDTHELLLLPNGNYVVIAAVNRGPVDLSAYGGSPTATVTDNVVEEIAPNGSLVWHWSAMDHLSLSETDPQWRLRYLVNSSPADPYHMNAVEADGNGFVISLRHLDAIVRVDKASGSIQWKLSGSPRPESLTFQGDPYGNFGGQHDVRVLSDGTLTVHDNGSERGRAPRAVRYSINTTARTATLVEQVTDPDVPASGCCGSARKLSGGAWVMSWGLNPFVTALTPSGQRLFRLTFHDTYFSYRAAPVPFGVLSRAALRAGMNSQFPR